MDIDNDRDILLEAYPTKPGKDGLPSSHKAKKLHRSKTRRLRHLERKRHGPDVFSTSPEEAKVLTSKYYGASVLQCCVHLLSLAVIVILLQLNFRGVYFSDTNSPFLSTKLEALQFAAKIQESLLYASLTAVVLSGLRLEVCNAGLSLGSLVSTYQFTQLGSLFSSAFWGGIFGRSKSSSLRRFLFSIALGSAALLAALAGPLSAIAIIPTLGWWPVPFATAVFSPGTTPIFHSNASISQIWPTRLTASDLPGSDCLSSSALQDSSCPVFGYSAILGQVPLLSGSNATTNFTIVDDAEEDSSRYLAVQSPTYSTINDDFAVIASSFSQIVARDINNIYEYIQNGDAGNMYKFIQNGDGGNAVLLWDRPRLEVASLNTYATSKPVVQIQCNMFTPDVTNITFTHSLLNTPPFVPYSQATWADPQLHNIYTNETWNVDLASIWNTTLLTERMADYSVYAAWVDLAEYTVKPSIAIVLAFPAVFPTACQGATNGDGGCLASPDQTSSIVACSVDARWLADAQWIDPTLDNSIHAATPDAAGLLSSLSTATDLRARPIDIGLDWAEALSVPVSKSPLTTLESVLNATIMGPTNPNGIFLPNYTYDAQDYAEYNNNIIKKALAMIITDGLARVGLKYHTYAMYNGSSDMYCISCVESVILEGNTSVDWVEWNIATSRFGYGYGLNTVTSKIAAVVLIIYGPIAIIAIAVLMIRNRTSNSWSSLSEIVALAVNSPPTRVLKNTGAGVGRLKTWKEIVRIRATEDRRLHMIFDGDENIDKSRYRTPLRGLKYK
ncbi:hypothetical protein MMC17_002519 [Xylographa soralifera]|nr:hypothetical protein [Xylographa soralifera]